ncbi:MAG TPA: hypothetical protein PK129_11360, partial [Cellvibrionaceae bacterium]|nr:hypothetical protein [Cellvibrionaceae bacterium]
MNIYFPIVALILISLGVTGCGSQKTGSSEQDSNSEKLAVTIIGQVYSGAAEPNTDVNIQIGDLKFTAKTDTNGTYQKKLVVDDAHASIPVKISAAIDPTRPKLILLTMLDSVTSLTRLAGQDKTLTADENILVDINFYSTATFGQMDEIDQLGIERKLDTDEKLHSALASLELDETLRYATILYLAVHGSGFNLPVIDNTLLFLRREGPSAYEDAFKIDPATVNKIKFDIGNKYRVWATPISPLGELIVYMRHGTRSYKMTFNSDFTGVLNQNLRFNWRIAQENKTPALAVDFEPISQLDLDDSVKELQDLAAQSALILFANDFAFSKRGQLFFYSVPTAQIQETVPPINDEVFATPSIGSPDCYIYQTPQLAAVMTTNLLGGQWFQHGDSDELLGLTFQQDNQVTVERFVNHSGFIVPSADKVHKVRQASWAIVDKKLVFTSPGATETYWFMEDLGYGYSYLKETAEYFTVDGVTNRVFVIDKGTLFKPQKSLNFSKEDFAGIWAGEDVIHVLDTSGAHYLDFGYPEQMWSFNPTKVSWQTATHEYSLLATNGGTYFFLAKTTNGESQYSFKVLEKNPN